MTSIGVIMHIAIVFSYMAISLLHYNLINSMHSLKSHKMFLGHYSHRPVSYDQISDLPVVSQCNVIICGKWLLL